MVINIIMLTIHALQITHLSLDYLDRLKVIVNGRGSMPSKPKRPVIPGTEAGTSMVSPFSEDEYRKGVATLKNNKAAGRDDVLMDQLKNLGPYAHKWLHAMLNHRLLIQKLYNITQDSALCRVIQNLLLNIRFYVELNNERSRWRLQKNGPPQGSVLSIILFNIYTNDQPIYDGTMSFIYADDLCITAQYPTFTEVEDTIEEALSELTQYYRNNSLLVNQDKTQVTAFHLRNREIKRSLNIARNGVDLENTAYPKYLGLTLDRTLNYKQHILNTKMKVATHNNLLKKLANSKWGTNARTIRTTALALCYSTAEYAAPVWARSSHANKLNQF